MNSHALFHMAMKREILFTGRQVDKYGRGGGSRGNRQGYCFDGNFLWQFLDGNSFDKISLWQFLYGSFDGKRQGYCLFTVLLFYL